LGFYSSISGEQCQFVTYLYTVVHIATCRSY
jgi:hypothetical protein